MWGWGHPPTHTHRIPDKHPVSSLSLHICLHHTHTHKLFHQLVSTPAERPLGQTWLSASTRVIPPWWGRQDLFFLRKFQSLHSEPSRQEWESQQTRADVISPQRTHTFLLLTRGVIRFGNVWICVFLPRGLTWGGAAETWGRTHGHLGGSSYKTENTPNTDADIPQHNHHHRHAPPPAHTHSPQEKSLCRTCVCERPSIHRGQTQIQIQKETWRLVFGFTWRSW